MSVAIVIASKHGSTREIGEEIARTLRHYGVGTTIFEAGDSVDLNDRTGVIIGSAVYVGKWMKEALTFVEDHASQLQAMPVWLFSSGPIGEQEPSSSVDPVAIEALLRASGARGHRIFSGKLDRAALSRTERLATKLVRAPEGDFRDFEAIDEWSGEIASILLAEREAARPTS
ncbi:MAG: flavodoxin domain-containing protein [Thermomicrobiales bacterium]